MKKFIAIIMVLAFLIPCASLGTANAKEYASFSSFYKNSSSWGKWAAAGGAAVACGVLVFFTGGTGSIFAAPFISTIGGWFGAAGLSGAAATSSGLAMLGGGSLATGGLGMTGGAALLTTAISGATEAGFLGITAFMQRHAYNNLSEELKNAPNFPPFINASGPDCIENAKDILDKHYDSSQLHSSDVNINALKDAIRELDKYTRPEEHFWSINYKDNIRRESLRVFALKSLLYFMMGDNKAAYEAANSAYEDYTRDDGSQDLLLFIRGVSGLLTKELTLNTSQTLVTNAIASDKESPLAPLLFSIYLSRVDALDMITPEFIKSFSTNLDGLPSDTAEACWALVGLTILSQLQVYSNSILIWKGNEHMLSNKNINTAIEFSENTYKSFDELAQYTKFFGRRMPDTNDKDVNEPFKQVFNSKISEFLRTSNTLQNTISELKKLKEKLESTSTEDSISDDSSSSVNNNEDISTVDKVVTSLGIYSEELQGI